MNAAVVVLLGTLALLMAWAGWPTRSRQHRRTARRRLGSHRSGGRGHLWRSRRLDPTGAAAARRGRGGGRGGAGRGGRGAPPPAVDRPQSCRCALRGRGATCSGGAGGRATARSSSIRIRVAFTSSSTKTKSFLPANAAESATFTSMAGPSRRRVPTPAGHSVGRYEGERPRGRNRRTDARHGRRGWRAIAGDATRSSASRSRLTVSA